MIPPVKTELTTEQQFNLVSLGKILEESDLNTKEGRAYVIEMVKLQLVYRNNMTQLVQYIAEKGL